MGMEDVAKKLGIKTDKLSAFVRLGQDAVTKYSTDIKGLRDAYKADPSEENLARLHLGWTKAQQILVPILTGRTEIARALNSMKNTGQAEEYIRLRQYHEAVKALGDTEVTAEIQKRLDTIDYDNPVEVAKWIRETAKATTADKVFEAWINVILTNPPGHLANIVGNTLTLGIKPVEALAVATVEPIRALLTGQSRQRFFGEAPMSAIGMFHGPVSYTHLTLPTKRIV